MSNAITRTYSFSNGSVADGGQVDSEVQNIVNTINNADAGTTTWTNVKVATLNTTTKATVPNGSSSTDAAAFGQLYVFQAPVVATTATDFSTASASFQTTNLSASITMTSSSHHVLVIASGDLTMNTTGAAATGALFRDNSNLDNGSFGQAIARTDIAGLTLVQSHIAVIALDAPGDTSAHTYAVKILANGGGTAHFGNGGTQRIILVEVS